MKNGVAKLLSKLTTSANGQSPQGQQSHALRRAFTLIELMAVILVVLVLAAIGMGVAGHVQKKVAVATTRSQIAAIGAALENYKSDWGYYPPTTKFRISSYGSAESSNNAILYRALFDQGKRYLTFPQAQMRQSYYGGGYGGTVGTGATNIFDVYGLPFNYYCSPSTPNSCTNIAAGYTIGGQVNVATYDLFSYGRDHGTFAHPNATAWAAVTVGALGANNVVWSNANSAVDDITNWGP